jgi:hypothetical protein
MFHRSEAFIINLYEDIASSIGGLFGELRPLHLRSLHEARL